MNVPRGLAVAALGFVLGAAAFGAVAGGPAGEGRLEDPASVPAGLAETLGALRQDDFLTPAALSATELDAPVAYFTYRGVVQGVTAREAIESSVPLEAVLLADGTYAAPSAETILSCARMRIMGLHAWERGVDVSPEELDAYAFAALGTADMGQIAAAYGMAPAQARAIAENAALLAKLRILEVGETPVPPLPPEAPVDAAGANEASAAYAVYVLGLLGDAWDAAAGTWAAPADGPLYEALALCGFDGRTATYATAQAAYQAAYAGYQHEVYEQQAAWGAYVNGCLDGAALVLLTVRS